jgi:acyl carrier protein phosphodiesterase
MNFLAHVYLSGDNPQLMIGNFIADFVKGRNALEAFEGAVKKGIYLHRAIDAFTDVHPVVSESKNRLRPKYRHYSGVIVDVFYDHFLASSWREYHQQDLAAFAAKTYATVMEYEFLLPEKVKVFFPYMVRGNWLLNYSRVEGIARALTGMSRRTPYDSKMDEAVNELIQYPDLFRNEFDQFFPELQQHVLEFIKRNP